jgi:hypothetical protein
MGGILLDFYLIGSLILQSRLLSLLATLCLWCMFTVLWIILPVCNSSNDG